MATFAQMVCRECATSDGEPVTKRPHQNAKFAHIQRETHDKTNHDGVETATVREFEAEAIGSVSRSTPPLDVETDDEEGDDE